MQFIAISTLLAEFQLGFPTGRDGATFRDSGTGKTFLSLDKGTPGQEFFLVPGRPAGRPVPWKP